MESSTSTVRATATSLSGLLRESPINSASGVVKMTQKA